MKIFKYKFSKLILAFIIAGIVLCAAGFASNIHFLLTTDINSFSNPAYYVIRVVAMFLIATLAAIILISLLISSYYAIDGTTLKTSFGIIKSKYDVSDVQTIVLDRETNKLTLIFKNESYIVIVVKEEWYDEFTDALCDANKDIEFSIKSKENSDKDDKKKG